MGPRTKYQGTTKDQNGRVIPSATVSVFLVGTTTAVTIYATSTGTTGVNSVTSDTSGKYEFYVDNFEYDYYQNFKLVITKSGISVTYDNIPRGETVLGNFTVSTPITVTTHVIIPKGVVLLKAATGTVTFSGSFEGSDGCFSGFSEGDITGLKEAKPEWWQVNTTPGTTDMSTALNCAVDSLSGTGELLLSSATYQVTSVINIVYGVKVKGQGPGISIIQAGTAAQNIFSIAIDASVIMEDFTITASVTKTDGAGVLVNGSTSGTYNLLSYFNRVHFYGQYYDIYFAKAGAWWVEDCYFNGTKNTSIYVANASAPDLGDSVIRDNQFYTGAAAGAAIKQVSSGGLKVKGNTIVGYSYAYFLDIADGVNTSILDVSDNHFANQTTSNIGLTRSSGNGTFSAVKIHDNHLDAPTTTNISIDQSSWLSDVSITNNSFAITASQWGIYLAGVSDGSVDGNKFFGDGTTLAIKIDSTAGLIHLGMNNLGSTGGISNGSTSSGTFLDEYLVALGGGAVPTLGTIGGSGPAAAGQNSWLGFRDATGTKIWIPVWK